MHESFEPGSNATVEREEHPLKQECPRWATGEGMEIDDSDEHS
jgi:hypothetical protein